MRFQKIEWLPLLSVLVPLAALIIWVGTLQLRTQGEAVHRVVLEGYDPIDPLSGHYLLFRYKFGMDNICENHGEGDEMCICVARSTSQSSHIVAKKKVDCSEAAKTCDMFVKGECRGNSFLTGQERYYFPDSMAEYLRVMPEHAEGEVVIKDDGTLILKEIYVGSISILEFVRNKRK